MGWRERVGFSAEPALVVRAETDPEYSDDNYGVPLSQSEEAEMLRRQQLEVDSYAAADFGARQRTWAGYWIDQKSRGAPVFLFAGDPEEHREALASLLPAESGFRVERVSRTLADLEALQEEILASWDVLRTAGIDVTNTGIDLIGNTVHIGVHHLTEGQEAELVLRFGQEVVIREQPPAVADACPVSNCRPMKGGMKITSVTGSWDCTSGFVVRRTFHGARLSILTAGHCVDLARTTTTGGNWYHSDSGTNVVFGNGKYETWFDNSDADVGLIELDDDEIPTSANKMYINNGSSGAIYTVTGYVPDSNQTVGSQACAYGHASNNSECEFVTDADESNVSEAAGTFYDILHTKEYSWNLIGGDSGGPIYQVASGTNRLAMGTHVHSQSGGGSGTGWYSPYQRGRDAYVAVSGGDWYYICNTAGC